MAQKSGKNYPKKGEIYWVDLDPTRGSETQKKRPALIVSSNKFNEHSNVVTVAPITSKVKKIYPFEVSINLSGKAGKVMLNQCRAVDKVRLGDKIENIDPIALPFVYDAIRLVFDL